MEAYREYADQVIRVVEFRRQKTGANMTRPEIADLILRLSHASGRNFDASERDQLQRIVECAVTLTLPDLAPVMFKEGDRVAFSTAYAPIADIAHAKLNCQHFPGFYPVVRTIAVPDRSRERVAHPQWVEIEISGRKRIFAGCYLAKAEG